MSVHYKFKACLGYDKVTFDGVHISVSDLKKAIIQQKKIGKSADFDLQITNQQTNEVYETDDILIPKNTTVTVARVPIDGGKKHWERNEGNTNTNKRSKIHNDKVNMNNIIDSQTSNNSAHISIDKALKSTDLANSDATEDEKIKQMVSQSTQDYDSSKFVKSRGMIGPLPPNYTCYRCGQQGHYIKHCPTNNMDIKRSTGIPRSFMIPAKADQKGALLTASGEYAVPIIDHEAYKEIKKDKHPFISIDAVVNNEKCIEEDILCMLCHDLLNDAVMIPCCGNSYCDDCIRNFLLESEQHQCPTCEENGISPDTLIPNRFLRNKVLKFRNEVGLAKEKSAEQTKMANDKASVMVNEETNQEMVIKEEKIVQEQVNNIENDSENINIDIKTVEEKNVNNLNENDDKIIINKYENDNNLSLDEVLITNNKIDNINNVDVKINGNNDVIVNDDIMNDDKLNVKIERENDKNNDNILSSVNNETTVNDLKDNKNDLGLNLVGNNVEDSNNDEAEKTVSENKIDSGIVSTDTVILTTSSMVTNASNPITTTVVGNLMTNGGELLFHQQNIEFQQNNLLQSGEKPAAIRKLIRPITTLVQQTLPIQRGPILQHPPPRGIFSHRPGLVPDPRFYRNPMRDHHNYNMSMGPASYAYNTHSMRPHGYPDMYNLMNRQPNMHNNHYSRHMSNHSTNYNEPPGMFDSFPAKDNNNFLGSSPLNMHPDGIYNPYMNQMQEYEDPLDTFVKKLQNTRHRRRTRSRSRSRSRSRIVSRRSRSRGRSRRSRSRTSRSSSESLSIGKEKKLISQLERPRERSRSKLRYKEKERDREDRERDRERDRDKDKDKEKKTDKHRHQHKSRRNSKEKEKDKSESKKIKEKDKDKDKEKDKEKEKKENTEDDSKKKHKHHKDKHHSDSKSNKKSKKSSSKDDLIKKGKDLKDDKTNNSSTSSSSSKKKR